MKLRVCPRHVVILLLFCFHGAATPCFAAGPKTDVIELLNGDRITCEIKKLDRGKLTVKTDGLGTISIEWNDVARVSSQTNYEVELTSGLRYFGWLVRSDPKTISVVTSTGARQLAIDTVIYINPIGGSLWRRLDGWINAGFSFTQANVQSQWTFDANVTYRGQLWLTSLDGDSLFATSEDTERQTRNTLAFQSSRFLAAKWSALGFAQFQQNEELSLNLRSVVGGGVLRVVSHTNRNVVTLYGGLAFTDEQYQNENGDVDVGEALAGVSWEFFTFDGRSKNMKVTAASFIAVTGDARARLELNAYFKSDIVSDLYWTVNLFNSFNSSPPTGQKKNDFGISAAVGWSF